MERRLASWALRDLPAWDNGITAGDRTIGDFVTAIAPVLAPLMEIPLDVLATLPTGEARAMVRVLGFLACSIEHHTQTAGRQPGEGLKLLPGVEDALAALSVPAALPPNLGLHGYWLANAGEDALSFTGDPQEAFFRKMVVEINQLHEQAAELLRPIAHGKIDLDSPAAIAALRGAADTQQAVHDRYAEFRVTGRAARFNMTVEFFRDTMRTYLVAFPVHGTIWRGPNAANIAAQASLDFVVGIVEPFYITHVAERLHYLTPDERALVIADMGAVSVLEEVLHAISLTKSEIIAMAPEALTDHLRARPTLIPSLCAFRSFERGAGSASGAHFGLIMAYLGKVDTAGHGGVVRAVDATRGTGGRSHVETKRVMQMRNAHPVARKLSAAIGGLSEATTNPDES